MTAATPAISFDAVGLRLGGETIYKSISFSIEPGEFVCILGPSGCGKSTALRLMGDLLAPSSGTVSVHGETPATGWSRLAYVFQSPRLLPWKTALQNAAFGLEMRKPRTPADQREAQAMKQLDRVGLGRDTLKMPAMLSGGEKQRVSIARALALEPDIILMDEPFSALDPSTRTRLRQQIVDLWQETGKTVVFVTHDIDEALFLADRIIMFSAKPAVVEHTISMDAARPRAIETDPSLRKLRAEMFSKYEDAENNNREAEHELRA